MCGNQHLSYYNACDCDGLTASLLKNEAFIFLSVLCYNLFDDFVAFMTKCRIGIRLIVVSLVRPQHAS